MITGDRAQIETPVGALGERAEASSRTRSGRALDLRATWAALVGARQRWALAAVLCLSAALRLVGLDREAYGNTYYAAAVKNMLTSWRNFFFVSFDAGGFVTVD